MAGIIGNAVLGALGGVGQGIANVAQMGIQQENRLDYAKQLNDLEEQRQLRIQEAQARLNETAAQSAEERTRDRTIFNATGAGGEATRKAGILAKQADLDFQTTNVGQEAANAATVAKAQAKAQADVQTEEGLDPKHITALKNIAQAQHVTTPSEAATAALASFELTQKKTLAAAQQELITAQQSGDQTKIDAATSKLQVIANPTGKMTNAADAVGAARVYEGLAKTLQAQLNDPMGTDAEGNPWTPATRQAAIAQIDSYRQAADSVLQGVAGRRGISVPTPTSVKKDRPDLTTFNKGGPASTTPAAAVVPTRTPDPNAAALDRAAQNQQEEELRKQAERGRQAAQNANSFQPSITPWSD